MELNQPNKLIEATPTVPAAETVTNDSPPPLEPQPTKPVDQTSVRPSVPHTATTAEIATPVQAVQPVEPRSSEAPLYDLSGYVADKSAPPDIASLDILTRAYGQQSMQNTENSSPPIQGDK